MGSLCFVSCLVLGCRLELGTGVNKATVTVRRYRCSVVHR